MYLPYKRNHIHEEKTDLYNYIVYFIFLIFSGAGIVKGYVKIIIQWGYDPKPRNSLNQILSANYDAYESFVSDNRICTGLGGPHGR